MAGYFYREVEKELRASAVPYHIEDGGKHWKVFIGGKMVMTFSRGAARHKDTLFLKRAIRRYLAEQSEERLEQWSPSSGAIAAKSGGSPAGNVRPY